MVATRKSLPSTSVDSTPAPNQTNTAIGRALKKLAINGTSALVGDLRAVEEAKKDVEVYHWRGAAYLKTPDTRDEWLDSQPKRYLKRHSSDRRGSIEVGTGDIANDADRKGSIGAGVGVGAVADDGQTSRLSTTPERPRKRVRRATPNTRVESVLPQKCTSVNADDDTRESLQGRNYGQPQAVNFQNTTTLSASPIRRPNSAASTMSKEKNSLVKLSQIRLAGALGRLGNDVVEDPEVAERNLRVACIKLAENTRRKSQLEARLQQLVAIERKIRAERAGPVMGTTTVGSAQIPVSSESHTIENGQTNAIPGAEKLDPRVDSPSRVSVQPVSPEPADQSMLDDHRTSLPIEQDLSVEAHRPRVPAYEVESDKQHKPWSMEHVLNNDNRAEHEIFRSKVPVESSTAKRRRIGQELTLVQRWEKMEETGGTHDREALS